MRIGIDVGGTNTDAVLMDGSRVVSEVKTTTSQDVTAGVVGALRSLIDSTDLSPSQVRGVMIGTTHFTNAVIEAKRLMPTATIRIGAPATLALPPMVDWPSRLRDAIGENFYICSGGHEFDGRPLSVLDPSEIGRAAEDIGSKGIRTVAISSVFSPVNQECEEEAAAILASSLPGVAISLSHEIGRMGLLERENATILNACLHGLAIQIIDAFGSALAAAGIAAPVYISQNDGTLMSVEYAKRYPVATFASGPTNSMRGAAFLSGLSDCAVVDIGGTTSDVGVLQHGYPREAAVGVKIGDVRTNFRMPDVYSFGLGGGSWVRQDPELRIGPDSVGYELASRALCFGGDVLTATDVAVAAGLADLGDHSRLAGLDREMVQQSVDLIASRIAGAVDRMKTTADPVPVVIVGGGSILLGDRLEGASHLVKPDHFAVANAIGAAIAQIGGEVDRIFAAAGRSHEQLMDEAKQEAVEKAVAAGATRSTVQVVDVDEVPISYLPGNAVRIRVKAVGELELGVRSGATGN
jgi:N-methylhydantoinase A/oxoprolinase/acetone carboxylase beta subunit